MMDSPKVSILMNCYNGDEFLTEAIQSVLNQTYPNWELIFWDNQSTDNSAKIIKSFTDSRIRYFYAENHTTLGEGRNCALTKCSGAIIGFLDTDDFWEPTKLERQIPLFNNPKVGIVHCRSYYLKGSKKTKNHNTLPPTGHIFSYLLKTYTLSLEATLIRKAALDTLSYWFDTRFTYIEEADLFRRIAYFWEADFVNELLCTWRVHEKSLTWTNKSKFDDENLLMLESFEKLFPNFKDNYKTEVHALKNKIKFNTAYSNWINHGRGKEFRNSIKSCIYLNKKIKCTYYASILIPGTIFHKTLTLLTNRF